MKSGEVEKQKQRDEWLSRKTERAINPGIPLVDPHHHLWDRQGQTYLSRQFLTDAAGEHNVISTVYVECLNEYRTTGEDQFLPVGETEFVVKEAAASIGYDIDLCEGIVAYADLSLGSSVERVLDEHARVSQDRFRGIRYVTAYDPDPKIHSPYNVRPGMLGEKKVIEATRLLGQMGLSLDTWVYFHQLGEVIELANSCPETRIVVDHCGGPIGIGPYRGMREEVFQQWKQSLELLAGMENVVLKFGGLAMTASGFGWHRRDVPPSSEELAEAWLPYFDVSLAGFGAHRMMFESNFPVDRAGASYTVLWNAFKRLAGALSETERKALLAETAARVYRLRGVSPPSA